MADATIRFGDKEIRLDVVEGVEGDVAIDISRLRSELGVTTIDRGFGNTAESTGDCAW